MHTEEAASESFLEERDTWQRRDTGGTDDVEDAQSGVGEEEAGGESHWSQFMTQKQKREGREGGAGGGRRRWWRGRMSVEEA